MVTEGALSSLLLLNLLTTNKGSSFMMHTSSRLHALYFVFYCLFHTSKAADSISRPISSLVDICVQQIAKNIDEYFEKDEYGQGIEKNGSRLPDELRDRIIKTTIPADIQYNTEASGGVLSACGNYVFRTNDSQIDIVGIDKSSPLPWRQDTPPNMLYVHTIKESFIWPTSDWIHHKRLNGSTLISKRLPGLIFPKSSIDLLSQDEILATQPNGIALHKTAAASSMFLEFDNRQNNAVFTIGKNNNLAVAQNNIIKYYTVADARPNLVTSIVLDTDSTIEVLRYSPCNRFIAAQDTTHKKIYILSVAQGKIIKEFTDLTDATTRRLCSFSPSGRFVSVIQNPTGAIVTDLETSELYRIKNSAKILLDTAFTADETVLVTLESNGLRFRRLRSDEYFLGKMLDDHLAKKGTKRTHAEAEQETGLDGHQKKRMRTEE